MLPTPLSVSTTCCVKGIWVCPVWLAQGSRLATIKFQDSFFFLHNPHSQVISFLTPVTCDKLNQNIYFPNLNLVSEISSVGWSDPFWGAIIPQTLFFKIWDAVLNGKMAYRVFLASWWSAPLLYTWCLPWWACCSVTYWWLWATILYTT